MIKKQMIKLGKVEENIDNKSNEKDNNTENKENKDTGK